MLKINLNKIAVYCDTSEEKKIIKYSKNKFIKGFTTNPSLMRSAGIKDYKSFAKKISKKLKNKPISFEVFSDDLSGMYYQAQKISTWGNNIFVKIPILIIRNHKDDLKQSYEFHINRSHASYFRDLLVDGCHLLTA